MADKKLPSWFIEVRQQETAKALPSWFITVTQQPQDEIDDSNNEVLDLTSNKVNSEDFVSTLKAFIQSKEAPRFGYDSWFGRGTSRGPIAPPKPPTQMTVNEILDWQNTHNPPGPDTTAAGAYQIVDQPNARTLSSLVREMGLTGDELFSPELQDRMAEHLMRRRGLDKFLQGKLDAQSFANQLAREWASLPVLKDDTRGNIAISRGQSYYRGDGVNKTLVKPDKLEEYEKMFTLADIQTLGE